MRDNDPVIFFEHKLLYAMEGDVPEEPYAIPFGEANFVREGRDVTIVTVPLRSLPYKHTGPDVFCEKATFY